MPTVLDRIDTSLRAAVAERNKRLRAWMHSENAETQAALTEAQRLLDAKLEQRFAAQ